METILMVFRWRPGYIFPHVVIAKTTITIKQAVDSLGVDLPILPERAGRPSLAGGGGMFQTPTFLRSTIMQGARN